MIIKPSYKAILQSVRFNKIKVFLIFSLDLIQVFCESGLLASTYLLLGYIQNNIILTDTESVPYAKQITNLLENIGLTTDIISFLILMLFFTFVQSLCKYFGQLNIQKLGAWIHEKTTQDISNVLFNSNYEKLISLRSGKLLSIGFESPEAIKSQLEIIACSIISILLLGIYSQILISLSIREFTICLASLLLIGSIQIFTSKRVKSKAVKTSIAKAEVNNILSEIIKGIKYIKASGSNFFVKERLNKNLSKFKNNLIKESIFFEITAPLSKLLGTIIIAFIVYIFSRSEINPSVLLPTIGVFIVTLQRLIGKISELAQLNNAYNMNKGRVNLYNDLIQNSTSKQGNYSKKAKNKFFKNKNYNLYNLKFKNIFYRFESNKVWILNNLSFNVNQGTIVGLVGRSGAGKSTILNLISGLIKPSKGEILINSEKILIDDFFSQNYISLVSQESYIIHGTILENIVWDQKHNRKRVLQCLEKIDKIDFINNLENGVDTIIGEGGMSISGGQIQIICIARAIYKDSSILILDEATNALDQRSEDNVMDLIKEISKNKIVFMVTHNIKNHKISDEIYLLEDGILRFQKDYKTLNKNINFNSKSDSIKK